MMQVFKIDVKHQIKSISNGFWNVSSIPVALFFLWLLKDINPFDPILIFGLLIWTLFWFIPVLLLHPIYYSLNIKTELKYNPEKKELEIKQGSNLVKFEQNDIKQIERIYYSDYRLPKWQQNYIPMPWRNYGLLRIVTNDNQEFILTSLMIDIVNPPIKPSVNKYKYIPFPPKSIAQKRSELKNAKKLKKNQIESFKTKFSKLTIGELSYKTVVNGFVVEAEIAAKELIEKNTTANN